MEDVDVVDDKVEETEEVVDDVSAVVELSVAFVEEEAEDETTFDSDICCVVVSNKVVEATVVSVFSSVVILFVNVEGVWVVLLANVEDDGTFG